MKDLVKRIRMDFILTSVLCIILGVVCIVWGQETFQVIGMAVAIALILFGVIEICNYLLNREKNGISAAVGIVVALVGIWIFIRPETVLNIIPIIMGVVLLLHGFRGLKESLLAKGYGDSAWWISALLAVISMLVGIICIVEAFLIVEWILILVGISLIYNGVSNLWIVLRVSKAEKNYRAEETAIDVKFKD